MKCIGKRKMIITEQFIAKLMKIFEVKREMDMNLFIVYMLDIYVNIH